MPSLDNLPDDLLVRILMASNDETVKVFSLVSPKFKHEAAIARAQAKKDSVRIISTHAIEMVPLINSEKVGWQSVNLTLIRLQGEEQGHMSFQAQYLMAFGASFLAEMTPVPLISETLRRLVCVWFVSAHAVELVPLLETVESVYGGWMVLSLRLIRLHGEEQRRILFLTAAFDSRHFLCGREHSRGSHPPGPPSFG